MKKIRLDTISEAIDDIRAGKMVIVVDDEDRENEGDFIAAAEKVSPEMINFMATYGRGLICTALVEERCDALALDMMVKNNTVLHHTQFTVSVDLIGQGCTTGISAHDRAKTIIALIDEKTKPDDLGRPGHIFPLKAKQGGVLRRTGHTEAAVDLARLAGMKPAGILVEILNEDGTMARLSQLKKVAEKFDLKLISIEDLVAYRMKHDSLIKKEVDCNFKTRFGLLRLRAYRQTTNDQVHIALSKGTWAVDTPVPTAVIANDFGNDILSYLKGDDAQNKVARVFDCIAQKDCGAVVFLHQERQHFDVLKKIALLESDEESTRTHTMDERDFGIGAQILHDLDIAKIELISNSKQVKRVGMTGYGLQITGHLNY